MKIILKNRLFLGSLCIFLATLLAFFIAPQMTKAQQKETTIYLLANNVAQGDMILEQDILAKGVPTQYLPNGIITNPTEIIGQYATVDLVERDYITERDLSDMPNNDMDGFSSLGKENVAISVTIKNFASGLSAKLQPDDIISFVAASATEETIIPEALTYMRVLCVTASNGTDYSTSDDTTTEEQTLLPVSITVCATPAQAALLANLEFNSNLHVALVSRGNAEQAQQLLQEQQTILDAQLAALENIDTAPQDMEEHTNE